MWTKGLAAALVAALLIVGISLLQGTSSAPVEASNPVAAKTAQQTRVPITVLPHPSTLSSAGSQASDDQPAQVNRGPSSGVWQVLGTSHAGVADERTAIITAFRTAPPCVQNWCDVARTTLAAWQTAIAAKVPGAVNVDAIECSSAGCWMKIVVTDPTKWSDVNAAVPGVTAATPWPGPSIRGGPDFQTQKGAVISIWAILPNVDGEPSSLEQGVER